jgi:hypothetical protein
MANEVDDADEAIAVAPDVEDILPMRQVDITAITLW